MGVVSELRRRNVFRVALAYIVVAWLILQVGDTLAPALRLPDWVNTVLAFFLILGFPLAIFFSWAYELTPQGLKKEKEVDRSQSITHVTGRKLDFVIIAVLVVALGYFGYDKFILHPVRDAAEIEAAVQSAREQVASAVEQQESAKTIAVLPFVNMSDDASNEYFSDGISEEILNLLAQVPELRVTSRSSAFSFKGQNVDVPTIAAKLNVAHILEGSVRKSGNELRITAQLIAVETDTHLWSKTYDRELKSVFVIQDEIAAAVVDALKITLLGEKPGSTKTNPEAYALYLQARHFSKQGTSVSSKQAETLLAQALEIDPNYVPAWTELGYVYERQTTTLALQPKDEGIELARDAIQKALLINPQYGPAYAVLARIEMFYGWDFKAASQYIQQALASNPGDAFILLSAARVSGSLGRLDEAISLHQQSIAVDPVSAVGHYRLGRTLYRAHRLDEALDSFRMALSLNPDLFSAHLGIGLVLVAQGDAPAALAEIAAMAAIEQEEPITSLVIACAQHALGNAGASDNALQALIEAEFDYHVAKVHAFRGDINLAFDWLNQAYDNRDAGLASLLIDPELASLHDDPRWESLLDKMGLLH